MAWIPFAAPSTGTFAETNRQGVEWVKESILPSGARPDSSKHRGIDFKESE